MHLQYLHSTATAWRSHLHQAPCSVVTAWRSHHTPLGTLLALWPLSLICFPFTWGLAHAARRPTSSTQLLVSWHFKQIPMDLKSYNTLNYRIIMTHTKHSSITSNSYTLCGGHMHLEILGVGSGCILHIIWNVVVGYKGHVSKGEGVVV